MKAKVVAILALVVSLSTSAFGEDSISLSSGKITMNAPKGWKQVKPKVRIIDHEFSIPALEGDKKDGRVTVMGAGGSVDANVSRWMGQFVQPDRKPTKERTKTDKKAKDGYTLHVVEITGTFLDKKGGPFAPGGTVKREKYRMLGAILVTKNRGQYFVKMYGPDKTIKKQADAFRKMVENAKIK